MESKTIEFEEILNVIKKKYKLIIFIILISTGFGAYQVFFRMKPSYIASVKIFSGKNENVANSYTKDELNDNAVLIETYIELIKTDNFMEKVIEKSGIEIEPDLLKQRIEFMKQGETPILTIKYKDTVENNAESIVKAITSQFEKEIKETITNVNIKVIEDVKVKKVYPQKIMILMFSFIVGLVFSLGVVLVVDYLDDRIKTKEDLEKIINVPVLGELSLDKKLMKEDKKLLKEDKKEK